MATCDLRERLGKRVREVWVEWAKRQNNPKPSWLVPYEQLSEQDKEADRCIGAAIWGDCVAENASALALGQLTVPAPFSLGSELNERVKSYPEVNWSEIVRKHFEEVLAQLDKDSASK
jgi:hypothetical protein